MIKLFTDLQIFPESFLPPIVQYNDKFIYVTSIEECDYILLPHWEVINDYSDSQYTEHKIDPRLRIKVISTVAKLISLSSTLNKQLLIVYLSDSDKDILVDNALIFRTSLNKFNQRSNVFAYPAWSGDFQVDYMNNAPIIRCKGNKPNAGFRGSAIPLNFSVENLVRSNINIVNTIIGKMNVTYQFPYSWNRGQILRRKAVKKMMNNEDINSDFTILTRGYISQKNAATKAQNRKLFVENIIQNDYILCVRGAGNYSYRLYETISAGRIPLLINTDCVLPYDFVIDWKKYCVWVEESEIDRIDEILLDFHHRLSNDDFMELQINIRKLWDEWISPKGFFTNFDKHFINSNFNS